MLIKACLNGSRESGEHPELPLTPEELAHAAEAVVAVGAQALYIHPRDAAGKQSLAAPDIAAALAAIRAHCPGIPVGISTGIWIEPDLALRLQRVREWTLLPNFASVNFSEPGIADLCNTLLARGIAVEPGLSDLADVKLLLKLNLAERSLRILIEPVEENFAAALTTVTAIIHALDEANIHLPRLLHGSDATTWPLLEAALQSGYATRIGLEDTLTLEDGRPAQDNAELVAFAFSKTAQI